MFVPSNVRSLCAFMIQHEHHLIIPAILNLRSTEIKYYFKVDNCVVKVLSYLIKCLIASRMDGSVVEFSPATREARVRFPVHASKL